MVSSFWEAVRRRLHLPGAHSPGDAFGGEQPPAMCSSIGHCGGKRLGDGI